jgi:DNA topoisomerase III
VENAKNFFTEGKTDLIVNMISKKGRPFSAFLVCHPGEKRLLSWEFPPREKKAPAAKGAKGAKKAAS